MAPIRSEKPANENAGRASPCPVCGKPATRAARPFCSGRCADVDLNRWLSGVYALPVKDDEGEAEPPDER